MSSGCGDVLNLEDLKTAKKHQVFEAEVITGKAGGVASGADIDYATNQATGQVQKTMPAILRDIGFETVGFDFTSGGTLTVNDRNKAVLWSQASGGDGGYYAWTGALPKVIPANSTPASSGGVAPGAWANVTDPVLRNDLASPDGAKLIGEASNIASLRSIEPTYTRQRVLLREHTTGTGKGGGEFRAVTGASGLQDNNGTIVITAGGNAWVRVFDVATPLMFGAVGNWDPTTNTGSDDSAAFQSAVNACREVYVPAGSYLVLRCNIPSDTTIRGEGAASVLYQNETVTGDPVVLGVGLNGGGTPDIGDNFRNINIRNLCLTRTKRTPYTSSTDAQQFRHLITLNACTDFKIQDCIFRGFNGDGIYVGGGIGPTVERHNTYGLISGCLFDGVDNENRNGISVIDCEALVIRDNVFRNCSSPFQPGPIDLEPNAYTFTRLLDIKILNNKMLLCKGSSSGVGLHLPNVEYTTPPSGFLIDGNEIDAGAFVGTAFYMEHGGNTYDGRGHNIRIVNNKVRRTVRPFDIKGINGLVMSNNQFDFITNEGLVGWNVAGYKCSNFRITGNMFRNVGTSSGRGIGIYTVEYLTISDNLFYNVGKEDGTEGRPLYFSTGSSSWVDVSRNTFENLGRTTVPITNTGHTFTPESTYCFNNVYANCSGNNIRAVNSNEKETSYAPTVSGSATAGSATYTDQRGRYMRMGNIVQFRAEIACSDVTGTGALHISLPTLATYDVSATSGLVNVYATGSALSGDAGMLIGQIIPAATVTGVSTVRVYKKDGSGLLSLLGSGTMNIVISGSYVAA